MTLTDALRAALCMPPTTHPSESHPLWQIFASVVTNSSGARRALVALVLYSGLAPKSQSNGRPVASEIPSTLATLVAAGGNLEDLRLVTMEPAVAPETPRSAEWTAAALRLAAWADGEVVK